MSYRCEVCGQVVPRGHPRRVHTLYRQVPAVRAGAVEQTTRPQIAREVPVCGGCDYSLHAEGVPLATLRRIHAGRRAQALAHRERRPLSPLQPSAAPVQLGGRVEATQGLPARPVALTPALLPPPKRRRAARQPNAR